MYCCLDNKKTARDTGYGEHPAQILGIHRNVMRPYEICIQVYAQICKCDYEKHPEMLIEDEWFGLWCHVFLQLSNISIYKARESYLHRYAVPFWLWVSFVQTGTDK